MKKMTTLAIAAGLIGCSGSSTTTPLETQRPEERSNPPAAADPSTPGATAPGAETPAAPAPAPAASDAATNLARLRGLSIVELGALIVTSETANCYYTVENDIASNICDRQSNEFVAAKADAEKRLAAFTDTVIQAAAKAPATSGTTAEEKQANLAVLSRLQIVQVDGLIEEQPKNNPNCYNLPCEEDRKAADAINAERAGRLENIANALE